MCYQKHLTIKIYLQEIVSYVSDPVDPLQSVSPVVVRHVGHNVMVDDIPVSGVVVVDLLRVESSRGLEARLRRVVSDVEAGRGLVARLRYRPPRYTYVPGARGFASGLAGYRIMYSRNSVSSTQAINEIRLNMLSSPPPCR